MIVTNKTFLWIVGIEFKITDGVWVVAGLGEETERIIGNDGIQLLSGLRMGISDKSRLKKYNQHTISDYDTNSSIVEPAYIADRQTIKIPFKELFQNN